jgi:hypothetical protein
MATKEKKTATVATPWGRAAVVEELTLKQQAGEQRFASLVQLLAGPNGERFVRFAYTTDGVARRGPVTLRASDVQRLHKGLAARPGLSAALGLERDA